MSRLRLLGAVLLALLPNLLKQSIYRRVFGYRIGRGVRIGLTPFVGVRACSIGEGARIGHLNIFLETERLEIGRHARVGHLNAFRGGRRVLLGEYATVLRGNVFNSIPDAECVNGRRPELELGAGVTVTNGHWLDFTDAVTLGANTIVGGRGSSFWTHNRQRTRPIRVGHHCYIGSDAKLAPGADVADGCIVAIGSVLQGGLGPAFSLVGGNPAQVVRPLRPGDVPLIARKNRPDIPDPVAFAGLPVDFRSMAEEFEARLETAEHVGAGD